MFRCERCGSSYSPIRVPPTETCPRCRARDGVSAPLTFAPFSARSSETKRTAPQTGEAMREEGAERAE